MNDHVQPLIASLKSILRAAFVALGFLLIPLWGIFNVDGWNWGWRAFVAAGIFVFIAALTYEFAVRGTNNKAYRYAVGLAVATAFALTWSSFVRMADGNPANALYFTVPVFGAIGAAIARLRARAMALVMGGMAIAQLLVPFIALVVLKTTLAPGAPIVGGGPNGIFIALFAISALLFRRAASRNRRQYVV